MFTGIVEETGEVRGIEREADGVRLRLGTGFEDLARGQSISVDGACLTVESFDGDTFEVFLATETVERTSLADLAVGDAVNLERALPAEGRLDGHFVQGHVDGTAEVLAVEQLGEDWRFTFSLPDDLARYVVEKGSIAVDGISLTVAARGDGAFDVAIIPETYELTNLSEKAVGDPVHLEVDVVAKYVERLVDGYVG
ncbi:riboflavin synthase [Halobacteriales archaeon QH_2_65_14]|jgi:riboflavin synthase|nr:MAG: riboflavin synthase [Halobacteriales archaeon QH_2_65_14]